MGNYVPYSGNTNKITLNEADGIYTHQGGKYSLVNPAQLGPEYSAGFLGSVTFGVEMTKSVNDYWYLKTID
jgi:hypothetical protein